MLHSINRRCINLRSSLLLKIIERKINTYGRCDAASFKKMNVVFNFIAQYNIFRSDAVTIYLDTQKNIQFGF
ncbi:hypothetical protein M5D96_010615 [Drosophila gunungcola]|uniref:Uncharacterized protein n=1 Tax=Drosophila gunungcola TaxID=103775 RepID=A0A9Q0BL75_9MUSC|nr:hypothetical protein M5D96_010615 [Drosophila gunungcola]